MTKLEARLKEIEERITDDNRLMGSTVERWSVERGEIHNRLDISIEDRELLLSQLRTAVEAMRGIDIFVPSVCLSCRWRFRHGIYV